MSTIPGPSKQNRRNASDVMPNGKAIPFSETRRQLNAYLASKGDTGRMERKPSLIPCGNKNRVAGQVRPGKGHL